MDGSNGSKMMLGVECGVGKRGTDDVLQDKAGYIPATASLHPRMQIGPYQISRMYRRLRPIQLQWSDLGVPEALE